MLKFRGGYDYVRNFGDFKGGPSPYKDKLNYDNPNHNRENVSFYNPRRMNHSYDGHAEQCFGMTENRNKESLAKF